MGRSADQHCHMFSVWITVTFISRTQIEETLIKIQKVELFFLWDFSCRHITWRVTSMNYSEQQEHTFLRNIHFTLEKKMYLSTSLGIVLDYIRKWTLDIFNSYMLKQTNMLKVDCTFLFSLFSDKFNLKPSCGVFKTKVCWLNDVKSAWFISVIISLVSCSPPAVVFRSFTPFSSLL